MKISREAWVLKEECFGPLLPYVKDQQVTDINYNGTDVWIEHLKYGIRKAPVNLTPEFAGRFSVLISNIVSEQINKFNNVLEAETDTLRISIIHPSVTNTGYSISDSVKQADLIDKPKDLSISGCLFAEQYSYIQKTVDVIFHSGCRIRILHHILNPVRDLPGIICVKCRQSVKTCRKAF